MNHAPPNTRAVPHLLVGLRDVKVQGHEDAVEVDGQELGDPVVQVANVDPQVGKRDVEGQDDHQGVHLEEVDHDLDLVDDQATRRPHSGNHRRSLCSEQNTNGHERKSASLHQQDPHRITLPCATYHTHDRDWQARRRYCHGLKHSPLPRPPLQRSLAVSWALRGKPRRRRRHHHRHHHRHYPYPSQHLCRRRHQLQSQCLEVVQCCRHRYRLGSSPRQPTTAVAASRTYHQTCHHWRQRPRHPVTQLQRAQASHGTPYRSRTTFVPRRARHSTARLQNLGEHARTRTRRRIQGRHVSGGVGWCDAWALWIHTHLRWPAPAETSHQHATAIIRLTQGERVVAWTHTNTHT